MTEHTPEYRRRTLTSDLEQRMEAVELRLDALESSSPNKLYERVRLEHVPTEELVEEMARRCR